MCMTKHTFIDYTTNPIKFSLVMFDNRGGFPPFINHGATELFQHSEGALRDSKAALRNSKREI